MNGRLFLGNVPTDGRLLQSFGDWALYERSTHGMWVNFKLVSMKPRAAKANYHFGYNAANGRMVRNRDTRALKQHEPEVLAWVQHILEELRNARKSM